nr:biotinidase isoform X1 [Nothobranchius furzeri]
MLLVIFTLYFFLGQTEQVLDSYIAAVYEHTVILNPEPRTPLSRHDALRHMQRNLDVYEEQAALAAQQGAQIIVYPEDGIHGFNYTRSSISGYLETIPDPEERWNPCMEPGRFNNTEVLQRLSCVARRYHLYLVANMADLQPCPLKTDPSSSCPSDGHWQFNTNVVFNSEGLLVARYHKHNLYFEEAFDQPPQAEIATFDTPFAGTFGLIVCFDILFRDPTVTLVEQVEQTHQPFQCCIPSELLFLLLFQGVRQLVFPTAWMNQLPLLDSIQFQQAFSLGANVSLLAANIRNDRLIMTGSGIYTPFSSTYHHARRGDPEEGRLLLARVPVLHPQWVRQDSPTADSVDTTEPTSPYSGVCHRESCADLPPPPDAAAVMMYDPFQFALLNETRGKLSVCDGAFCCHLQYEWIAHDKRSELYALGAFAGTHVVNGHYALQVCAVVRCAALEASSCGQEVEEAESKMDFLLEATFDTRHVYPSVLASRLVLEHPEKLEKAPDGRVVMKHSSVSGGLVTACLYGRMYHLDQE